MNILAVFIILLCMSMVLIAFFFGGDLFVNKNDGEWIKSSVGPCINTKIDSEGNLVPGSCSDPGKQTIVERCVPNPVTGNGCFTDGKHQYGIRLVERDCQKVCHKSAFVNITPDDVMCVARDSMGNAIDPDLCFDQITDTATITETFKCVSQDDTGENACTTVKPDGSLTVHSLGDVVTREVPCDSYSNRVCGQWTYLPGALSGTEVASKTLTFSSTPCAFNPSFVMSDICHTVGGTDAFQEGFHQDPMSCRSLKYDPASKSFDQILITPTKNDSLSGVCEVILSSNTSGATGVCMTSLPSSSEVESMSGVGEGGLVCGDVNGYSNYTCLSSCRKWDPSTDEESVYVPFLVTDSSGIGPSGETGTFVPVISSTGLTSMLSLEKAVNNDDIFNSSLFCLFGDGKIIAQSGNSRSGWLAGKETEWFKLRKSYNQVGYLSSAGEKYDVVYEPVSTVNKPLSTPTGSIGSNGMFEQSGTLTITQERVIDIKSGGDKITARYQGTDVDISRMSYLMFPFDSEQNIDLSNRM